MDPRLLGLYEGELSFLREMGEEFARAYPKVASRLDLGSLDVADPYIERLLEGCAFLTARIQLKMEQEFPTFTESLLQIVYPHYFAPTPSMAIVQFRPDPAIRTLPRGVTLPRGTELRSLLGTEDQTNCEFRTGHAVRLLPIEIADAEYIPTPAALGALQLPEQRGVRAALRLRLRSLGEVPFSALDLSALPLFLSGPPGLRMRLYEQLAADLLAVVVRPTERPVPWVERLEADTCRPIGFDEDEALLPRAPASFDGYRLLQEYFALPDRFLFVELGGLARPAARCTGQEMDIVLLLGRSDPTLSAGFAPDHLALFATPAINLFPKRSDRINLSTRAPEHHVVPDRTRPLDFEVFGIEAVEGYGTDGGLPMPFEPFYGVHDRAASREHAAFYTLRREPRPPSAKSRQRGARSSYLGHEVFVSLVDPEQAPVAPGLRQLGLELLCTNRDLPISMPVGKQHTDFTVAVSAPVAGVRVLVGPTVPRPCRTGRAVAWRFISHLGLNYLSLADSDRVRGAAALRELLSLYVPQANAVQARQLEGLVSVAASPMVARVPGAGPIAMGRGLEIALTIDESHFEGAGGIVLAAVLDRFFRKYVSINAFTQTVLRNPERGEIKRWPVRFGMRGVL